MDRALSGVERQWWVQSMRASCNIGIVTCFAAPVDRAELQAATAWLQKRYPLLAAGIELGADGEPRFVSGKCPPIAVAWHERTSPDAWQAIGAREIATDFPSEGPFIRFAVVAGADATEIMLCMSHTIADGLSMAQIIADLIRCIDEPGRPVEPVVDRGPFEDRTPASYRGGWWSFTRHVWSQIWGAPHDPARNARLAAGYRGRPTTEWVPMVLEPDQTERLREKSRAEGTTVQGAFTAAMTIAVGRHEARHGRKRIAVHYPINARAILEPPVVEEIGNYAAGTTKWLPTDAAFWDLARVVKADIELAIARGVPFANVRFIKGSKRTTPRTKPRWLALRLWPDLHVTNLGLVKLPDTPLGARVREMHILTALHVMQSIAACIVTLDGRLFCNLVYSPGDFAREDVVKIAQDADGELRKAMA